MRDDWWPVSSHSMVLLLFNAIHYQRSFPPEVPPGTLMDVCVCLLQENGGVPHHWRDQWRHFRIHGWVWHDLRRLQLEAQLPLVPRAPERDGSQERRPDAACQVGDFGGIAASQKTCPTWLCEMCSSEQVTLISEWSQIKKEFAVRDIIEPFVKYHINLTNVFSPPTV